MRTVANAVLVVVTFALGGALAVAVSGSATAASAKRTTTAKSTTTPSKRTTTTTGLTTMATTPQTPASQFFVVNGTVNAASDHEIVGSSAFPNFSTGAVDNYYSLAHAHVDNSPFAEGTASPADTGPVGQTAAAGNFQQPQYADARWPGGPDKAAYGSQGGPYATASAREYKAKADASAPSNDLRGPGPTGKLTLPVPKGFDDALRQALAVWKAKWQGRPVPATPAPPALPVPNARVTVPRPGVTTPVVTVPSSLPSIATPNDATSGGASPAPPPVTVSTPAVPAAAPPRSLSATSASPPADGETLLSSSTEAALVPRAEAATADTKTDTTKTDTTKTETTKADAKSGADYVLVTKGESSLGRVSIGGGQIVVEGIHVTASITNDGTSPSYKAAVSVASASIGGVPVTIDEDGVHVAGQGQALPYQQASDALNGALKQAGIRIFLVAPEVTTGSCGPSGGAAGSSTTTTTTTSTSSTTSTGPSGSTSSCNQSGASTACSQPGTGPGGVPGFGTTSTTTSTTSTSQSGTTSTTSTSPCGQTGSTTGCEQGGTGTGTTTTTTTSPTRVPATTSTTTPAKTQPGTTTTSSCGPSGTLPTTGACQPGAGTGTTAPPGGLPGSTAPPGALDPMAAAGGSGAGEQTVTATGVHVVFTQPVNQAGVPAQYVEHILGEVFVDSLAAPAPPLSSLDASFAGGPGSSSTCAGGGHSGKTASGSSAVGGSSAAGTGSSLAGGSAASSGLSPSGSAAGAVAPSGSGSSGNSLPAAFAEALRKPLWLLLAYVVWQSLVIATGVSLWHWRRGEAS